MVQPLYGMSQGWESKPRLVAGCGTSPSDLVIYSLQYRFYSCQSTTTTPNRQSISTDQALITRYRPTRQTIMGFLVVNSRGQW